MGSQAGQLGPLTGPAPANLKAGLLGVSPQLSNTSLQLDSRDKLLTL